MSWAEVIEETLRIESPIAQLPLRFATEDIELAGVTIGKGDPILIGFAGAGRDPGLHGCTAGGFDPTRTSKEHVNFGYGVLGTQPGRPALVSARASGPASRRRPPAPGARAGPRAPAATRGCAG